ncbi:hypothetical protein, partial [Sedimentimonas flavescens]|uniref:hypothetical protein n=1 Tax=Sedimentimonas flavescens TaxID=2851012 RepID=UPI0021A88088
MISITSAVLRFAVQRLMLSSIVILIATFSLVARAGFHGVDTFRPSLTGSWLTGAMMPIGSWKR